MEPELLLRRNVARVVLLDPRDNVLLIRSSDPFDRSIGSWWELPGGGIESGETSEAAARRELFEETGLRAETVSAPVWRHHVSFEFAGMHFDQDEVIHLAWGAGGEYQPAGLDGIEGAAMSGASWWAPDHLAGLDRIIPPWLSTLLPQVLADGIPAEPFDLGHVE